jgi:hypothetical protein
VGDPTNSAETTPPRRVAWMPYVVGAVVGALVTVAIVALLGGFDSGDERSTAASTTTTTPATGPPSPLPTTTAPTTPGGAPPQIVGFGVSSSNCPAGATSTTVRITYQTIGASTVSFAVDGGSPSRADDTSGSRDVGPIPCDARPHVVTLIAEANGQRATRDATVSVS